MGWNQGQWGGIIVSWNLFNFHDILKFIFNLSK